MTAKRFLSTILMVTMFCSLYVLPMTAAAQSKEVNLHISEIKSMFGRFIDKIDEMPEQQRTLGFIFIKGMMSTDESVDELSEEIKTSPLFENIASALEQEGITRETLAEGIKLFKIWDVDTRLEYIEKMESRDGMSPIDEEVALYEEIKGQFEDLEGILEAHNIDLGTLILAASAVKIANNNQAIFTDDSTNAADFALESIDSSITEGIDTVLSGYTVNGNTYTNFNALASSYIDEVNARYEDDRKNQLKDILGAHGLYEEMQQQSPTPPPSGGVGGTSPGTQPEEVEEDISDEEIKRIGEGSEDEVTDTVGSIAERISIDLSNRGALDSNSLEKVANIFGEIASVVDKITTEENAQKVSESVTAMIESVANLVKENVDEEVGKKAVDSAKQSVELIATLLENVQTLESAQRIAESVITSTARIIVEVEQVGVQNKAVADKLVKISEQVIEKAGKQQFEAQVEGDSAVAVMADDKVQSLIEKMIQVAEVGQALQSRMDENSIHRKVETKVVIDISVEDDINQVSVEIPTGLLEAVSENEIQRVEVAAGLAKVSVEPDFIKATEGAVAVSLDVKRAKLTQEQQALVGSDVPVYEFHANIVKSDGNKEKVSNFEKEVVIRLPYVLKSGEDKDNITVLYLANDGTIKNMVGRYDESTGEVVCKTNHFSKFVIKHHIVTFSDVPAGFWGSKFISSMASKGIINGRTTSTYEPDGNITRAEFAKLITVTMGLVDETALAEFTDLAEGAWYTTYVASAAKAGIVTGDPEGTFRPDANISRQEMAVMIARALNEPAPRNVDRFINFNDTAKIADWAKAQVATAVRSEILTGKPGNIMDPTGKSTRAEAATIIYRIFNY